MSKAFKVKADLHHQYADAEGTIVEIEIKAGDFTPATEGEEVAAAHLHTAGLIEEAADKPTKNKKADPTADEITEE